MESSRVFLADDRAETLDTVTPLPRDDFEIVGYRKAITLPVNLKPDIFSASRFSAVLKNVALEEDYGVDFADRVLLDHFVFNFPACIPASIADPCVCATT
jgi:ATP-dependent phosphoenolpyruvate carboxykinase